MDSWILIWVCGWVFGGDINEDASADNVTNDTPKVVNVTEVMTSDSYVKNETTYNSEIDNSKYMK